MGRKSQGDGSRPIDWRHGYDKRHPVPSGSSAHTAPSQTQDRLDDLADAARRQARRRNTKRWDFITVRDPDSLRRLSGTTIYAKHLPSAGGAIALVVPAPDPDHARSVLWDIGRAAQNIILAAWAMGIGSCPITVQDFALASDGLAAGRRQCQYIMALGWPTARGDLTRPPRRWPQAFEESCTRNDGDPAHVPAGDDEAVPDARRRSPATDEAGRP
jgi:nitroreductase